MSTSTTKTRKKTTAQNKTLLTCAREVARQMHKKSRIFLPVFPELKKIMNWGKLSADEACTFCIFLMDFLDGVEYCEPTDIQTSFEKDFSEYAEVITVLDKLFQKGFITQRFNMPYVPESCTKFTQFFIHETVIHQVVYNEKKFTPYFPAEYNDSRDCLGFLCMCAREGYVGKWYYYFNIIKNFFSEDPVLKMFLDLESQARDFSDPLDAQKTLQLFTVLGSRLLDSSNTSIKSAVELITDNYNPSFMINVLKAFKSEKTFLLKKGIFEIEKSEVGEDIKVKWGKLARAKIFKGDNIWYLGKSSSTKELGVVKCKDIKEKALYYNDTNQKDVDRLYGLLEEKRYQEMRKRLEEKNLPKGLIILLYGAPGTGKTETVNQLARMTGRDLFHLNLQEVRSCWVGESEKNTKAIFDAYRDCKSKKKPILLFNEADGIVSKRSNLDGDRNSAVSKMENTMQNIILEEMEKFDGIMILTTNMSQNFDPAFDRRILFKLKFENPSNAVKAKIWKSKLEFLKDDEAATLASLSDLSGGQIENISRKVLLDELLYGNKPSLETLKDFVSKEKLFDSSTKRIGFGT